MVPVYTLQVPAISCKFHSMKCESHESHAQYACSPARLRRVSSDACAHLSFARSSRFLCFYTRSLCFYTRSLLTLVRTSATSHHKTPEYQSQMGVKQTRNTQQQQESTVSSSNMENNLSSSSDVASRTRVEYRPAEAERMVRGTGGGMRPSSAVLAHSLAAKSMAFLEKHQYLSASISIMEKDDSFRDAGGGEGNRGGVRGDSALFQDDFLNRNPILMEYMAQAAMEGLESEDDGAGPAHARWEDEEGGRAGGGGAAEDEIKFMDVQPAKGEKAAG
jgi:hypothetical protein